MVIDLNRCVGCQTCVVACKVENNVRFSSPEETARGREINWMQVLPVSKGEFPEVLETFIPVLCNHCDKPACVPVCPTGATYKSESTGLIGQIYTRCIGCRFCAVACPYTARYFNWDKPNWPEEMRERLNPDASVRTKSVIEKCTFCAHRLQKAREQAVFEDRELRDGDYATACQEACPTKAIVFGDLDDPDSRVAGLTRSHRASRLREELGTEPKVFYLDQNGGWDVNYNDG
jgi:molybdopterin-containing oxidoreductase family iron-sulfur binding subunit